MSEKFFELVIDERFVATLTLNRPEVHNAFNDQFISELINCLKTLRGNENLRLLILTGNGKSFCAGADLNWMKKMSEYSFEENLKDSEQLAELFYQLNTFPTPTLLKLNGHALGGGAGLVACCDEVIAISEAELGFTEVKLGLVPAVISPFVINKIGETHARASFLSGRRMSAVEAQRMGLIHHIVETHELDNAIDKRVKDYLTAAPKATRVAKDLIKQMLNLTISEKRNYTTELISELRISEEGQSGMKSMLNKEKPFWIK